MKICRIKTWDEGEFICEDKKEVVERFLENYGKKNGERLKAAGYKQIVPEIQKEEMPEEEYRSHFATCDSAMYFAGVGLKD